jgi:hypothetical protein
MTIFAYDNEPGKLGVILICSDNLHDHYTPIAAITSRCAILSGCTCAAWGGIMAASTPTHSLQPASGRAASSRTSDAICTGRTSCAILT